MKIVYLIIPVLIFCQMVVAKEVRLKPPTGWKQSIGPDGTFIMKKGDRYNSTLVSTKYSLRKPMNWKKIKLDKKVKRIEKLRSRMLAFTGVRDWKIKDYKLVSLHPPQDTLVLVGSYRGVSGQQVQFYEVNIYDHEDHFQLTYTQDRAQGIDKTEVKQLLSKMELHQ